MTPQYSRNNIIQRPENLQTFLYGGAMTSSSDNIVVLPQTQPTIDAVLSQGGSTYD